MRSVRRHHGPRLKKHLGQHLLTSARFQQRIIDAGQLHPDDVVLEIGPGTGALTRHLTEQARKVYAVEADPRMCDLLRQDLPTANLQVIEADILAFDFSQAPDMTKIFGNLPYNISSPIMEKLVTTPPPTRDIILTVQWEFGQRLAAGPGGKDYGSLSCFVQYHYDVELLFKIPPAAFRPPPKVSSGCVRLRRHAPQQAAGNTTRLFRLIRMAFAQRRKTMLNALSSLAPRAELEHQLRSAGIDPALRAEKISLEQFVRFSAIGETEKN